jgi:lipopolysaccharide/colanic/teichoic acid biosynthesis glycosyltransferase
MYLTIVKPFLDFLISLIAFLIFLPLFVLITIILSIANSGNPFFIQIRPGKHARLFRLIKFKTMNDRRDKEGKLLPDSERLTTIGRFLRRTSIDEIPQLINVLKGEMSLVGPRPLLMEYLPLYSAEQSRRHDVKPGMTGWAQINGRNAISWDEKFRCDVWYVDHWSLWLDIKILAMTMLNVVLRKGINHNATETMPFFQGSNHK